VDLRELVSRRSAGEPVPRNAVALTFDDGYRDNYELAFPVLRKWQVPATIFLATSFIDQLDVPWNDKIAFALRHTRRPCLDFEHGRRQHSYDLTGTAQKLQARDEILWLLRHIPHGDKQLLIGTITTALGVTDFAPLRESMLTWDHVREMHRSGIAFGAHTITHAYLTRLKPPEARNEICGSKQRIEAVLDSPVALFAYPAGTEADFNDDIKGEVRKAGFEAAVTTVFGFNDADTDLYALRRGGSAEHDQALFALQQAWYKLLN
jgi:peptidoglycan/xylan/chitin deacetylase (PgdA/CDA1 family)